VLRSDVGFIGALATIRSHPLRGRLGAGFLLLSPRPLPYGDAAAPVALLDLSAALGWRWIELGVDIGNVLAQRFAANEYSFVSNWGNRRTPSLVPARHIAAGPPFSAMGTLGLVF
jgi:hypothetical protein